MSAREVYTRRSEGVSIWVVPSSAIHASDPDERDAWFELMMNAIDATLSSAPDTSILKHPSEGDDITAAARGMFRDYFSQASTAMINQRS